MVKFRNRTPSRRDVLERLETEASRKGDDENQPGGEEQKEREREGSSFASAGLRCQQVLFLLREKAKVLSCPYRAYPRVPCPRPARSPRRALSSISVVSASSRQVGRHPGDVTKNLLDYTLYFERRASSDADGILCGVAAYLVVIRVAGHVRVVFTPSAAA